MSAEPNQEASHRVVAGIRAQLAYRGMTQKRLAEEIDMPLHALRRRMVGQVALSVDDIVAIASALKVPASSLLPPDIAVASDPSGPVPPFRQRERVGRAA